MATRSCPICKIDVEASEGFCNDVTRISCQACGDFSVTREAFTSLPQTIHGREYVLSALTRRGSDSQSPILIATDNVSDLINSVSIPTVLEKMERALLYMSKVKERPDDFVHVDVDTDYPLVFARDAREFSYLLELLADRDLLQKREVYPVNQPSPQYRLTPEGWDRVEEIRYSQPDSGQAFVAMWFTDALKAAWEQGFKPALESTGYTPIRVDIIEHNRKIDDLIVAEIRRSGLLVADFTGNRGGVYFEAGFAMGLGIPIIWTCKDTDMEAVHFDTRQYNHIVWSEPKDLRDKLQNRIVATIPGRFVKDE